MYRNLVRRRIRALFDAINQGDANPVLQGFAPEFQHIFLGQNALSGRRDTLPATREWYQRLFLLLPDIHFDLHRIDVSGPPWATLAVIEWTESNSGTDGVSTTNCGVHIVHLKWGKMTRLLILTDTAVLDQTLLRLADTTGGESLADPIDTKPGWPRIP